MRRMRGLEGKKALTEFVFGLCLSALYEAIGGFKLKDDPSAREAVALERFKLTVLPAMIFLLRDVLRYREQRKKEGEQLTTVDTLSAVTKRAVTPVGLVAGLGYLLDCKGDAAYGPLNGLMKPFSLKVAVTTVAWYVKNAVGFGCGCSRSQTIPEEASHWIKVTGLQLFFCNVLNAFIASAKETDLLTPGFYTAVSTVGLFSALLLFDVQGRIQRTLEGKRQNGGGAGDEEQRLVTTSITTVTSSYHGSVDE